MHTRGEGEPHAAGVKVVFPYWLRINLSMSSTERAKKKKSRLITQKFPGVLVAARQAHSVT